MPTDDLQRLWQCQPVVPTPIDLNQIRRRAGKLHGRVRARNLRETIAGVIAVVILTWFGLRKPDPLDRTSFALLIAGTLYVLWHLWKHGQSGVLPADFGLTDAVTFHRRELERQRDLLRGIFRWYLAPFIPGWALSAVSAARYSWAPAAVLVVFVSVVIWFTLRLNYNAADRLDRCIAELSRSKESE
jgi:hypothetical protein